MVSFEVIPTGDGHVETLFPPLVGRMKKRRQGETRPSVGLPPEASGPNPFTVSEINASVWDALPAHIALVDSGGRIISVNQTWKRFGESNQLGLRDFGVGSNYLEVCENAVGDWAEEAGLVAKGLRDVLKGGSREFAMEYPCHSPERKRWFRLLAAPISLKNSPAAVVMHVDITDRKLAEEEAAKQAALLRIAGQSAKVAGWSAELPDLQFDWSNESACIRGVPQQEKISLSELVKRFRPAYRDTVREAFEGCVAKGEPFELEAELVNAGGETLWIRMLGEAVHDERKKISRIQGSCQDITYQKELSQSLAWSEKRFRDLAETMPLIVWSAEPNGTVDFSNHHFCDYTGIGPEEPPSSRWQKTLHPDDLERCLEEWSRCTSELKPFRIEYRIRRGSDGAYRWFRVEAMPVFNEKGECAKWYGVAVDIHETKLLEAEGRQLAERLTDTLESITDSFYTVDRDWRFTFLNREAERHLGEDRKELIGQILWEAFPDMTGSPFEEHYRGAMARNQAVAFEAWYEPLRSWFSVRAYPSKQGLAVYFPDITAQREAAEALRVSEERFRLLGGSTQDVIWDWDLRTNEVWWSESFESLFGVPVSKIKPNIEFWYDRLHPDEKEAVSADLHRAIQSGTETWFTEYRLRRYDGSYAFVLDRGRLIRNEQGEPVRMIGGITDLTERKQHEEKLAEQAALLDKAQDAIMVRDLDGCITYWNKSAERLYGWQWEEVIGKSERDLLYPDPARFDAALGELMKKGEWVGELKHLTKDRNILVVEGHWTLVRDMEGQPRSVLAINTDVTEKKRMEEQFLRAQRLESIGTLAGGIAHDLNNVLSPIMMAVEVLEDQVRGDEARSTLQTLRESARRGADLVKQVLTFARGVEGRRIQVDPFPLAKELVKVLRETLPKNIEVHSKFDQEIWRITGDPTQLHQILMNLCVNARDAMPDGGVLSLTLENMVVDENYADLTPDAKPGPYLLIKVQDNGEGMPSEIRQRIFEPFFTTKEEGKGTGLGLSTVMTIVKSHGGFVNVYSEEGKGTLFKVYLPAHTSPAKVEATATAQTGLPRGKGKLILVTDDEEAIRRVVKSALERFGYRVLLACNGAEAVSLYAQHQKEIAAVLTDMAMPIMDGPALIIALKAMNPEVQVIGTSGLSSNGGMAKAVGAGVQHFVPKPYTAESLLQTLHQVLKEHPPTAPPDTPGA